MIFAYKVAWLLLSATIVTAGLSVAAASPMWHTPMSSTAAPLPTGSHAPMNV